MGKITRHGKKKRKKMMTIRKDNNVGKTHGKIQFYISYKNTQQNINASRRDVSRGTISRRNDSFNC